MQGAYVGAVVKIVSDEQERPTILGTTRGQGTAPKLVFGVVESYSAVGAYNKILYLILVGVTNEF